MGTLRDITRLASAIIKHVDSVDKVDFSSSSKGSLIAKVRSYYLLYIANAPKGRGKKRGSQRKYVRLDVRFVYRKFSNLAHHWITVETPFLYIA